MSRLQHDERDCHLVWALAGVCGKSREFATEMSGT